MDAWQLIKKMPLHEIFVTSKRQIQQCINSAPGILEMSCQADVHRHGIGLNLGLKWLVPCRYMFNHVYLLFLSAVSKFCSSTYERDRQYETKRSESGQLLFNCGRIFLLTPQLASQERILRMRDAQPTPSGHSERFWSPSKKGIHAWRCLDTPLGVLSTRCPSCSLRTPKGPSTAPMFRVSGAIGSKKTTEPKTEKG